MADEVKSNIAGAGSALTTSVGRARALGYFALLVAPALSGCAMSFPMSSMLPDDVTGSISKAPFGALLDEEDRRRETAALATALDPQGDGATVHWENQRSGRKGSLTAVGQAFPQDTKVCRAFLGDLVQQGDRREAARTIQGIACAATAGVWEVRDAKPFRKA